MFYLYYLFTTSPRNLTFGRHVGPKQSILLSAPPLLFKAIPTGSNVALYMDSITDIYDSQLPTHIHHILFL